MKLFLVTVVTTLSFVVADASNAALDFLCQLNADRAKYGLPPYGVADELMESSKEHADDMAAHTFMSPTGSDGSSPGDRITKAGFNWQSYREIVSYGYPDSNLYSILKQKEVYREMFFNTKLQNIGGAESLSANGTPYYTIDFGLDDKGTRPVPPCQPSNFPKPVSMDNIKNVGDMSAGMDK